MSVEAITWALKQPVPLSSAKFVLVALANCASAVNNTAFPSIQYLVDATSQDRKTVISNLKKLVDLGYIRDTGERRGSTRQVIVYSLCVTSMSEDLLAERHYTYRSVDEATGKFYIGCRSCVGDAASDRAYFGSGRWIQSCRLNGVALTKTVLGVFDTRAGAEEAERALIAAEIDARLCMNRVIPPKRPENGTVFKSSENGTDRVTERVPKTEGKSPVFGLKESQKRDTEPSLTVSNQKKRDRFSKPSKATDKPRTERLKETLDWLAEQLRLDRITKAEHATKVAEARAVSEAAADAA